MSSTFVPGFLFHLPIAKLRGDNDREELLLCASTCLEPPVSQGCAKSPTRGSFQMEIGRNNTIICLTICFFLYISKESIFLPIEGNFLSLSEKAELMNADRKGWASCVILCVAPTKCFQKIRKHRCCSEHI